MLVAIASGRKLLFKISGPMVVVKVGIIIVFGFAMVPHWNFANISAFPEASVFFRDVLLTIPFCFFSAVFIQVLNPMNIAYRKRVADRVLATRMAIRTHRISYITLIAVILFFSFSFTFSISHEEAVSAFEQNISALALAAQVIPGQIIHITSTVLNIFAVLTAFFGIYLGFHEAIKGIILNVLSRVIDVEKLILWCLRWVFVPLLLSPGDLGIVSRIGTGVLPVRQPAVRDCVVYYSVFPDL